MLLCAASCGEKAGNGEKMELTERITVTDEEIGAVPGDGTDDSPFILRAIAEAEGKRIELIFPTGEYTIRQDMTIPENVTLCFDKGACFKTDRDVTVTLENCSIRSSVQAILIGEGKYKGRCSGEAYLRWMGAEANGADVSEKMQTAVDIFDTVKLTPGSTDWRFDGIVISKPTAIRGEGAVRVPIRYAGDKDVFRIASGGVTVKDLSFTGTGSGSGGSAVFYFDTSACSMSGITVENCFGQSVGSVVRDAGTGENHVSDFTMEGCAFTHCYGIGICTSDFSDGLVFRDVVINNVGFPAEITWAGWHLKNVTGALMDNIDAAGGFGSGSGAAGFIFEDCRNIEVLRGMQDYVNGSGLILKNCSGLRFSNFVCSLYEEYGLYLENVTDSVFEMTVANGIYPTVDVMATRGVVCDAVKLVGCSGVTFRNLTLTCNQSDGIVIEDSHHLAFHSVVYAGGRGDCLIEEGTSDYNAVDGLVCGDNYSGSAEVVLIGSHSSIRGASFGSRDAVSAEGPAVLG